MCHDIFDQQAEISLCRVYKRAGVEDHPSLPRSLPSSSSSSRQSAPHKKTSEFTNHPTGFQSYKDQQQQSETSGSSNNSTDLGTISLHAFSRHNNNNNNTSNNYISLPPMSTPTITTTTTNTAIISDDRINLLMSGTMGTGTNGPHSSTSSSSAITVSTNQILFSTMVGPSFLTSNSLPSSSVDDLHRLVNHYGQYHSNHPSSQLMMSSGLHPPPPLPPPSIGLNMLPAAATTGSLHQAAAFNLWDWNAMSEASKDYNNNNNNPFK